MMNSSAVVGASGPERSEPVRRPVEDLGPVHVGSLDVRGVSARVEYIDNDPVLLVDDGDVEIEFSCGMGGTWEQAIAGTERLAAAAAAYAEELRRRGPAHRGGASGTDPAT